MSTQIAFLRGINVGGHNKLPMATLRSICEELGFENVRTYIQSGNIIFDHNGPDKDSTLALESALQNHMGTAITVIMRSPEGLKRILDQNPFPEMHPAQVGVSLFKTTIPQTALAEFKNRADEHIFLSQKEIYVYYPQGMGKSKLKFPPALQKGTIRNINTLTKLADLL